MITCSKPPTLTRFLRPRALSFYFECEEKPLCDCIRGTMSSEEIIDVQPTEHKENGETEAPAAIPQDQQQVHEEAKEVP